jgi:hypothetical protein
MLMLGPGVLVKAKICRCPNIRFEVKAQKRNSPDWSIFSSESLGYWVRKVLSRLRPHQTI